MFVGLQKGYMGVFVALRGIDCDAIEQANEAVGDMGPLDKCVKKGKTKRKNRIVRLGKLSDEDYDKIVDGLRKRLGRDPTSWEVHDAMEDEEHYRAYAEQNYDEEVGGDDDYNNPWDEEYDPYDEYEDDDFVASKGYFIQNDRADADRAHQEWRVGRGEENPGFYPMGKRNKNKKKEVVSGNLVDVSSTDASKRKAYLATLHALAELDQEDDAPEEHEPFTEPEPETYEQALRAARGEGPTQVGTRPTDEEDYYVRVYDEQLMADTAPPLMEADVSPEQAERNAEMVGLAQGDRTVSVNKAGAVSYTVDQPVAGNPFDDHPETAKNWAEVVEMKMAIAHQHCTCGSCVAEPFYVGTCPHNRADQPKCAKCQFKSDLRNPFDEVSDEEIVIPKQRFSMTRPKNPFDESVFVQNPFDDVADPQLRRPTPQLKSPDGTPVLPVAAPVAVEPAPLVKPQSAIVAELMKANQALTMRLAEMAKAKEEPEKKGLPEVSMENLLLVTVDDIIKRITELRINKPTEKDMKEIRAKLELERLAAKIKEYNDMGVTLTGVVTLTPSEELKFPPAEHEKHIMLKQLGLLKDKRNYLEKRRMERENASKSVSKMQDLYRQKQREIADLQMKLQEAEAKSKTDDKVNF